MCLCVIVVRSRWCCICRGLWRWRSIIIIFSLWHQFFHLLHSDATVGRPSSLEKFLLFRRRQAILRVSDVGQELIQLIDINGSIIADIWLQDLLPKTSGEFTGITVRYRERMTRVSTFARISSYQQPQSFDVTKSIQSPRKHLLFLSIFSKDVTNPLSGFAFAGKHSSRTTSGGPGQENSWTSNHNHIVECFDLKLWVF